MARRNRDLAGLAALGALGMYMARDGKDKVRPDGSKVPVEDRRAAARGEPTLEELARGSRDLEGGITPQGLNELGEKYSLDNPPAASTVRKPPSGKAPSATTRSMSPAEGPRRNVAGDYTRKMGATAEDIAAYNRSQQAAGTSTKPREGVAQASTRSMARDTRPDLSTPEGRKKAEQGQALERVTPEEMLVGGPGLKAVHAAAKRLAAPRLAEYTQPLLSGPTARLTGPSRAELNAADRAARDAARRAETARENAARYNTEGPIGGEGFIMRKKGGMVKAKKMASGGMTSASKRADGIASRGKTKCKIY
jgi:hypothetical protein